MTRVWNEMRSARIQVALEAVLLKRFRNPSQVLERKIIQSREFRKSVLPVWASHCLKFNTAYTTDTIGALASVKVCTPQLNAEICV